MPGRPSRVRRPCGVALDGLELVGVIKCRKWERSKKDETAESVLTVTDCTQLYTWRIYPFSYIVMELLDSSRASTVQAEDPIVGRFHVTTLYY